MKNIVAIIGITLMSSGLSFAGDAPAKIAKAEQPYYMSLPEAVVVWHKVKGAKLAPVEYSRLYAEKLQFNNEFDQKRKIKEVTDKHAALEKTLLNISTFTFSVQVKLKDYDFDRGSFATDFNAGDQLIGIGGVDLYHDDTKIFDKFLVHFDRVTIKYALSVKMPDAFARLEMPQDKAEQLLEKLNHERAVECVFSGIITGATEDTIAKGSEDLDLGDKADNIHTKEVVLRELVLKLLEVNIVVPDSGTPGKALKTWKAEDEPQFEKA